MTKRKTLPIKDTIAALANRLPIGPLLAPRPAANFDKLGLDDIELIKQLEKRGYWGYIFWDAPDGTERVIEVKRD